MKIFNKVIFFLLLPVMSFSQIDSIKISNSKLEESIVKVENLGAKEIYNGIKKWVFKTYKNPNLVLKSDIYNEYLRIDGVSSFSFKWMGTQTYNYSYSVSLNIKDGKYKIQFSNIDMSGKSLPDFFYDKKGERKKQKVNIDMYNSFLDNINLIHFDLYNSIISKKEEW